MLTRDICDSRQESDPGPCARMRPRHQKLQRLTLRYEGRDTADDREGLTARFFSRIVKRADLFIDAGAHHGFFSLLAAESNSRLEIIALEPHPDSGAILRRNAKLNKAGRIEIVQAAVSAETGTASLEVTAQPGDHGPHNRIDVETISIDSLIVDRCPHHLLIKISASEHELAVLAGMQKTLARIDDVRLIVEFNAKEKSATHELLAELDRLGFAMFAFSDENRQSFRLGPTSSREALTGSEDRCNIYCVRNRHAMSVVLFSHNSGLAGAERSFIELVDELVCDHGVVCTVVAPGPGPLVDAVERAGAATIVQPGLAWWAYASGTNNRDQCRAKAAQGCSALCALLPRLRTIDPCVIYTQTMVIPWGALAAALLYKPHIWSICEFGKLDYDFSFVDDFPAIISSIASSGSFLLSACQSINETLFREVDADRIHTLYRHIPLPDAPISPAPGLFKNPDAIHLGLFGRVCEGKGQHEALLAVAELVRRGRDVELVLVGQANNAYRCRLDELISNLDLAENVRFVEFLEDPYPGMVAADLMLVCSRNEAFGRVAAEAMLLAKPIVYARSGGPAEYLEDGVTGLAYEPGDVAGLARSIEALIEAPERAATLGAAARRHAEKLFSRDAYGGEVFRILRHLTQTPQPPVRMPAQLVDLMAQAMARVQSSERTLAEIQRELNKAEESLRALGRRLAVQSDALEAIHTSTIWRLIYPLRALLAHYASWARKEPALVRMQDSLERLLPR